MGISSCFNFSLSFCPHSIVAQAYLVTIFPGIACQLNWHLHPKIFRWFTTSIALGDNIFHADHGTGAIAEVKRQFYLLWHTSRRILLSAVNIFFLSRQVLLQSSRNQGGWSLISGSLFATINSATWSFPEDEGRHTARVKCVLSMCTRRKHKADPQARTES